MDSLSERAIAAVNPETGHPLVPEGSSARIKYEVGGPQAIPDIAKLVLRIEQLEKKLEEREGKNNSVTEVDLVNESEETSAQDFNDALTSKGIDDVEKVEDEVDKLIEEAAPEKVRWSLAPAWLSRSEYFQPVVKTTKEPKPYLEILNEPVVYSTSRFKGELINVFPSRAKVLPTGKQQEKVKNEVHRIRINSPYICDAFNTFLGESSALTPGQSHVRPFKVFLAYQDDLRKCLKKYEEKVKDLLPNETSALQVGLLYGTDDDLIGNLADHQQVTYHTFAHLSALMSFLKDYLGEELDTYTRLRAREQPFDESFKVFYADLWSLYHPGDLVFRHETRQVSKILSVDGGRRVWRKAKSSSAVNDERVVEDHITDFRIVHYHLMFDGRDVGPYQTTSSVGPFEGSKAIEDFALIPIEYAGSPWSIRRQPSLLTASGALGSSSFIGGLRARGIKYSDLASRKDRYHRDYDARSLDDISEHIDSDVIIDLEMFYRSYPAKRPQLGFRDPAPPNYAEVSEDLRARCECHPSCRLFVERSTNLYDDYAIDSDFSTKAKVETTDVVKWKTVDQKSLREKYSILFPQSIEGFVLKNRGWHKLDVDHILPIVKGEFNFDDLILPPRHKEIVRSLVEAHMLGPKNVDGELPSRKIANNLREDLVRGKGKGLIILLHGVPGVGKTSTAECVAELTRRPLFALTCGDIGDDPETVEKNLRKNFNFAYRWGCVMLLDEADVYLEQRAKGDMKRNAVVSVFLRILEYYSGILFLTTNKVGTFDEAFKSRIHISLYYKPLNRRQTLQIWEVNLRRIKEVRKDLEFDEDKLIGWAKKFWKKNEKENRRPWNGRQIHNAVRTAAALAACIDHNKMDVGHLKSVAKTSEQFDKYLTDIHGVDDISRAEQLFHRADDKFAEKTPDTFDTGRKRSEVDSRRNSKSEKKAKSSKRAKKRGSSSDSSDDSSATEVEESGSDSDEEDE